MSDEKPAELSITVDTKEFMDMLAKMEPVPGYPGWVGGEMVLDQFYPPVSKKEE